MAGKPEIIEVKDENTGLEAWVAIDTSVEGLSFGGFRIHPSVTREVVEELAACMTLKLVAHGLPVGGAKGGMRANPSSQQFGAQLEVFARKLSQDLRTRVILGKDVGATDAIMQLLYKHAGVSQLDPVRNRCSTDEQRAKVPAGMSGFEGYIPRMTAYGVMHAALAAQTYLSAPLAGKKILIQGSGVVGTGAISRFMEMGARIVGINDHKISIWSKDGFSAEDLWAAVQNGEINPAMLKGPAQVDSRDRLFQRDADILVLAALSNTVDENCAEAIRAPLVVEGANFALLPKARLRLHKKGTLVIPDIIASSSSAALVTHQMRSRNTLPAVVAWSNILEAIRRSVYSTLEISRSLGMEPRQAFVEKVIPGLFSEMERKEAA